MINLDYSVQAYTPSTYLRLEKGLTSVFLTSYIFKKENINLFLDGLKEVSDYKVLKYPYSKSCMLYCDIFELDIEEDIDSFSISGAAKNFEIVQKLYDIYEKSTESENLEINLKLFTAYEDGGDFDIGVSILRKEDISNEKYYPYLNIDLLFKRFYESDENILIMVGEPGLGKSKFSNLAAFYLGHNVNIFKPENSTLNIVSVQSIRVLSLEKFWRFLEENKINLVILDDLDFMLSPRDLEERSEMDRLKNDFLNNFLSFTDGLIKNKTKFIITTNQDYSSIDSALMRKGRLFDLIQLRRLKETEAKNIWTDAGLKEEDYKLGDNVLASDLAHEIFLKKLKINEKDYLLDKSVSISLQKKKIGIKRKS